MVALDEGAEVDDDQIAFDEIFALNVDHAATSIYGGWLLTGEKPGFSTRSGIWGTTRVLRPVGEGGSGAFELVARYDDYDFTDAARGGRGKGYTGRLGLFELLIANDEIRHLAGERVPSHLVKKAAMQAGMRTLRQDGWRKVGNGLTTIDEVMRVTGAD